MNVHQAIAPAHRSPSHHRCHVSHFGLDAHDLVVLQGLFRMRAELQRHYVFEPAVPTRAGAADILFVNTDDAQACRAWRAYEALHPQATAILVSHHADPQYPDAMVVTRPLSFRHLDDIAYALRSVTPADAGRHRDERVLEILVVDDSATARDMIAACIDESRGTLPVHLAFAGNGEQALAMAESKAFDLVFLDVEMPGIDGYETCRAIKAGGHARVALLSGRGSAADYAAGHRAGCDHYLAKPASRDMVRTVLRVAALKQALPMS